MPGYVRYYDGLWAMSIFPFPLKRKADSPCFLKKTPLWLGVPGTRAGILGVWQCTVAYQQRPLSLSKSHSCGEWTEIAQCQLFLNPHLQQPCSGQNCLFWQRTVTSGWGLVCGDTPFLAFVLMVFHKVASVLLSKPFPSGNPKPG